MKCITTTAFVLLYVIGFSLGDALADSLGNVTKKNKGRSLNVRTGSNTIGFLGGPKPTMMSPIQQSRPIALTGRPSQMSQINRQKLSSANQRLAQQTINNHFKGMNSVTSLPKGVPPLKPLGGKKELSRPMTFDAIRNTFNHPTALGNSYEIVKSQNFDFTQNDQSTRPLRLNSLPQYTNTMSVMNPTNYNQNVIPEFQTMPHSVSRISNEEVFGQEPQRETHGGFQPDPLPMPPSTKLPVIDLLGHTVEELAAAANVSVAVIESAILMRQKELLAEQQAEAYHKIMTAQSTTTTTTTTTTTPKPLPDYAIAGGNKVMNAPKEYYPVGYEKNFDDNFTSKVDLPVTSFHCGHQKHFPGLYADEDLGCMVFHVCALTDDGLVMKSFLCPESTLFDQTVLKCNWWFYVDCKNSKELYDSNIPVSKSHQLMKALTFFSNYKTNPNDEIGVDIESLRNSVNENNKPT